MTRHNVNPADAAPWARRPPRDDRRPSPTEGRFGDPSPDPWHDPTVVDPGPLPF